MAESSSSNNGIGFVGVLQIVFIILKLLDKITWTWLWVLAPIWISTIVVISTLIIVLLITLKLNS